MDRWLSTVPGLHPDAARRAGGLFGRHGVDDSLMDFLASEGGLQILTAWRDHQQTASEVVPDEDVKQVKRPLGRQKIPAADRRDGGHYFSSADATQSNSGSGRKKTQGNIQTSQKSTSLTHSNAAVAAAATAATIEAASALPENNDAQRLTGVLKSFSCETNYGFVRCSGIVQDVFLRGCDLPSDCQPDIGRQLSCIIVKDSQGRPQARDIRWEVPARAPKVPTCTGIVESEGHRFQGKIKSTGSEYGFIDCPEASRVYGRDVYFSMAQLPLGSEVGQLVSFDMLLQPQAKRIMWVAADSDSDTDTPATVCSGGAVGGKRW